MQTEMLCGAINYCSNREHTNQVWTRPVALIGSNALANELRLVIEDRRATRLPDEPEQCRDRPKDYSACSK